jgi:hypothetical protein
MMTTQGWKPAELIKPHHMPNSYIIKSGSRANVYRRNRKELMITREKPHNITPQRENYITPPPIPQVVHKQPQQQVAAPEPPMVVPQPRPPEPRAAAVALPGTSRFGRIRKQPAYLQDYVKK